MWISSDPVVSPKLKFEGAHKSLYSAVRQAFDKYAVAQRCQWHKREDVVAYLTKAEQLMWRRELKTKSAAV